MVYHYIPSTWKRLMARGLDQIFIAVMLSPIVFLAPRDSDGWLVLSWPVAVGLLLFPVFYEAVCYYLFLATPGKWILKLQIQSAQPSNHKDWFLRLLLRSFVSSLSFFFSWGLYATAFWRYDRRHLGDLLSETRVVGAQALNHSPPNRPWLGIILLIVGAASGWETAQVRISEVEFDGTNILIPDPFEVDFSMEDEDAASY